MWPFKAKPNKWLANNTTGSVHIIGKITNQCNIDDMTSENWNSLESVAELNNFLSRPFNEGIHPHFCLHCVR